MMSVSILLSDGSLGVVSLTPVENLPNLNPHPIQLIYLQEFSPDVEESFKSAALAVCILLTKKGLWSKGSGYAFVCEIKDEKGEGLAHKMRGSSGGLALSLALIFHILKVTAACLKVAATGVITNVADGTVGPVGALEEKLRGGIQKLPPGSKIYYPRDNRFKDEDLASIKVDAEAGEIALIRVRTLEEAARDFLPTPRWWWKFLRKAIWLCLAFFFAYLTYAFFSCPVALHFLERGRYESAESHLSIATRLFPWKSCLREICQTMDVPFKAKVRMSYLLRSGMEGQFTLPRVSREPTLTASDSYAFRIFASVPVYLYVIRIDSGGRIRVLFPSSDFSFAANPLEPNTSCSLPDKGCWFRPDGHQGLVETCFILSRWRCKDLEEALLVKKGGQSLHVQKHDLELMITERYRSGHGACVERISF